MNRSRRGHQLTQALRRNSSEHTLNHGPDRQSGRIPAPGTAVLDVESLVSVAARDAMSRCRGTRGTRGPRGGDVVRDEWPHTAVVAHARIRQHGVMWSSAARGSGEVVEPYMSEQYEADILDRPAPYDTPSKHK